MMPGDERLMMNHPYNFVSVEGFKKNIHEIFNGLQLSSPGVSQSSLVADSSNPSDESALSSSTGSLRLSRK